MLHATIAGAAETFAGSSFYGMLAEPDRAHLRNSGSMHVCAPGSRLMIEGGPAANVTVLVRGWAKSAVATAARREVILHIYGPGDLFGSEAILLGQSCPETVTARGRCLFLVFPGDRFAELLSENRNMARAFRHAMEVRAQASEDRVKSSFYTPARRLALVLLGLGARHGVQAPDGITIAVEFSQEELAGMIGVSRSSAARVLRNLRLQGIVHTGYRRITLAAVGALEAIAKDSPLTGHGQGNLSIVWPSTNSARAGPCPELRLFRRATR